MAFIELTLSSVSEPVLIHVDKIVLVEQKPLHVGGYVSLTLNEGKEFTVLESYQHVKDSIFKAHMGEHVLLTEAESNLSQVS